MKKTLKEYFNGYANWCKEGKKYKYGNIVYILFLLVWLPITICMCWFYYSTGKSIGYNEKLLKNLNTDAADKMSEDKTSDN